MRTGAWASRGVDLGFGCVETFPPSSVSGPATREPHSPGGKRTYTAEHVLFMVLFYDYEADRRHADRAAPRSFTGAVTGASLDSDLVC